MKTSKELEEIAKKDPMEMTKEDIVKVLYHQAKNFGENPIELNEIESTASGFLMFKEEDPQGFIEDVKIFTALAMGKYTPGKGVFKKKYATNPYFPSR
jgi:hypothetical protein